MMEITLYPGDIETLNNGNKIILFEMMSGTAQVAIILDKSNPTKKYSTTPPSNLSTDSVDNPVSNVV